MQEIFKIVDNLNLWVSINSYGLYTALLPHGQKNSMYKSNMMTYEGKL